jgi:hypothetical protein
MRYCRRRHFLVLAGIFVLSIAVAIASPSSIPSALSQALNSVSQQSSAEAPSSFSFGAGGDIGANSSTSASLDALKASGASFFLALGDMSYDEVTPESAWCDYIKQRMGSSYPFELIVGNHEETTAGPDGFIDRFAACLPDRLGASGLYAHQYYFDYPAEAPLARFILIDPGLYRGAAKANYCMSGDTTNCDWLKARIDEAKSQGLWTVVGMHKNCITMGVKSCEIGAPLLNALVERKVDVILQGHEHGYQRSKQLSLGAGCTALAANVYDSDCVIDDGTDGAYAKGAGSVLAIAANFGRSSNAINTSDPEAPYFSAWMDPSLNSRGFLLFSVSRDTINAQFVSGNGSYSDSFVISTEGTPSPTPTPGGTVPPVPTSVPSTNTVTLMAEADSYVRSDQRNGNFGKSLRLRTDGSPVVRSYLRFNVQGLEGPVANATLYVYANSGSSTGYQVGGVSDNRWTEARLTYKNAPAVGSPVGSSGAIEPNTWTRVDVTALVGDNGTLNLAMFASNETAIAFSSREGTNPPLLVVATGEQTAASQVAAAAEPPASKPSKDSDGDGLRDADELQNNTDPDKPDTDGDGLPDLWEVEVGLNPLAAVGEDGAQGDPEGDGTLNLDEFNRQTDPWGPDATGAQQLFLPLIESGGTR